MTQIIVNRKNWLGSAEKLVLKTITVPANTAHIIEVDMDGNERKVVPSGTYIATTNLKGLLFNDIDITSGAAEGSLVISGYYIDANLPVSAATHASTLAAQGLREIVYADTVRPSFGENGPEKLTIGTVTVSTTSLSWTKVDKALRYEVYMSSSQNGTYAKVADVAQGETPTYATTQNGWFKVKAIGDNLYSLTSDFSVAKQVTSHS